MVQSIIKLSKGGCGHKRIPSKLGLNCSPSVIYRVLKENNIDLSKNPKNKKYTHDTQFFKRIDTERKAYWLGFLYADGNVYKNTVSLSQSTDNIEHLKTFNKHLLNNTPVTTKIQSSWGAKSEVSVAYIYSKEMCQDLIKLGCVERKSLTLEFPTDSQVPNSLLHHFIRGYIDGDGSISSTQDEKFYSVGVLGTKSMVEGIKTYLSLEYLTTSVEPRAEGVYYINFGGNLQVLEKLDYIYKDATVYLKRKYDTYKELKGKYPQELIEERKSLSSRFR